MSRQLQNRPVLSQQDTDRLSRLRIEGAAAQEALPGEDDPVRRRQLRRAVTAGERARHQLIEGHLRLALQLARRCQPVGVPLEDVEQDAVIGLTLAVDRFDPSRGFKFSTYASHWIRREVKAAGSEAGPVRLPRTVLEAKAAIRHVDRDVFAETGRPARPAELQVRSGLSPTLFTDLVAGTASARWRPLDGPVSDHDPDGATLSERIPDSSAVDPAEELVADERAARLRQAVDELDGLEATITRFRFGLDGDEPAGIREVADRVGLSRTKTGVIAKAAVDQLRDTLVPD